MPDLFLPLGTDGPGETDRPAADRLIAGEPVFTTWNAEDRDGLYAGLWRATPGKWRVRYDEWEFFHIREGVSVLTDEAGNAHRLEAGTSFVIRPGFQGTWEVLETTLKDYVIRI